MSFEPEEPLPYEGDDSTMEERLRKLALHRPSADLDRRVLGRLESADEENVVRKVEVFLRSMPLRGPSVELDRRVRRLGSRDRTFRWGAVAAAFLLAALGTFMLLRLQARPQGNAVAHDTPTKNDGPEAPVQPERNVPVVNPPLLAHGAMRIQRNVTTVSDQGLFERESGAPVRILRAQTIQQVLYVNPADQSRTLITVPIEQVVVQPVMTF